MIKLKILLKTYVIIIFFYLIQYIFNWPGLKIDNLREESKFADLTGIISAIPCFELFGNEIYNSTNSVKACSGFIYSTDLLRILQVLSIGKNDGIWLGYVFGILFLVVLCHEIYLVNSRNYRNTILIILAATSPTIWLLLERANFDIIILALIYSSALLIRTKFEWMTVFLIGLSACMKYYTLPLLLLVAVLAKNRGTKYLSVISLAILTPHVYGLLNQVIAFPKTWYVSFGSEVLPMYVNKALENRGLSQYTMSTYQLKILGICIVFLGYNLIKKDIRIFADKFCQQIKLNFETKLVQIYIFFTCLFLLCYISGVNYDYRLAFLVISLISSLKFLDFTNKKIYVSTIMLSLMFSSFTFGLKGNFGAAFQLFGDLNLLFVVCYQIVCMYKIFLGKLVKT